MEDITGGFVKAWCSLSLSQWSAAFRVTIPIYEEMATGEGRGAFHHVGGGHVVRPHSRCRLCGDVSSSVKIDDKSID